MLKFILPSIVFAFLKFFRLCSVLLLLVTVFLPITFIPIDKTLLMQCSVLVGALCSFFLLDDPRAANNATQAKFYLATKILLAIAITVISGSLLLLSGGIFYIN